MKVVLKLILIFLAGFTIGILTSCKSKEYVYVPEYHTSYVAKTDTFIKNDSVYLKDSIFIETKGDTVYYNKVTFNDKYHYIYKIINDTIIKNDAISVPTPAEKQLSKEVREAVISKMEIVAALSILAAFAIIAAVVYTIHWYKNKKC